ncbi:MAG: hypothetical protein LBB41_03810, partial [Prevotellaceae bacterium]|nr:hypothetical protein [Prevotellaceae bacterium]
MNTKLSFIIPSIIILALIIAIRHYLNKEYNLNGTKRWFTTSKYGRIVFIASNGLLGALVVELGKITEKLVLYYHLPN